MKSLFQLACQVNDLDSSSRFYGGVLALPDSQVRGSRKMSGTCVVTC